MGEKNTGYNCIPTSKNKAKVKIVYHTVQQCKLMLKVIWVQQKASSADRTSIYNGNTLQKLYETFQIRDLCFKLND